MSGWAKNHKISLAAVEAEPDIATGVDERKSVADLAGRKGIVKIFSKKITRRSVGNIVYGPMPEGVSSKAVCGLNSMFTIAF